MKYDINKKEFKKILLSSNSLSDICRLLNTYVNAYSIKKIKGLIKKYDLNTNHFDESKWHKKKYNLIEKECPVCKDKFLSLEGSKKKTRKVCSRGCANRLRVGITYKTKEINKTPEYECLNCNSKFKNDRNRSYKRKFCSNNCTVSFNRKKIFKKIENGTFKYNSRGTSKNRILKSYLIEKNGYICMICKLSEWMDKPIPLQLDHIDGNSDNDKLENIRNICPNCHSQTPTYCNKNRGNGKRKHRLEDYHKGKDKW